MFTIISPTRVEVDGKDAGLLYDFIIANPAKASEIKAALVEWHAGHVRTQQERDADVLAAKIAADARAAAAEDAATAQIEKANKRATDAEADLAVLGTPEDAAQRRKEKERAELLAKLAALDGEALPADKESA